MYQQAYYVDKNSHTFADSLAAFGLAFVLSSICDDRAQVTIEDAGPAYRVVCDKPIQEDWVENCQFFTGAPFLATIDNTSKSMMIKGTRLAPQEFSGNQDLLVDYQAESEQRSQYFNWLKALSKDDRRRLARGEISPPVTPHIHWDLFRAINPAALQGYNSVVAQWWQGREAFSDLLKTVLLMTSRFPNDIDGAELFWNEVCRMRGWEKPAKATLLQLYNPAQGKGINNPKASWSAPNNLKGFWLLEWLKITGFYSGGITRTISGTKDRKSYVLIPCRLGWNQHLAVMREFRSSMRGSQTAIKLDILATLRYTAAFLKFYKGARATSLAEELFGERPADLVRGMDTAFYKDLGNSTATMNIASLNLPRWVAPTSSASLVQFQLALEEHIQVIGNLREDRGDQYDLLLKYRDFLSASDLSPFFAFTTAYSGFIMSQRERNQFVKQFSTHYLEVLIMNSGNGKTNFSQILQNEGFRNVAYAIRHSTVVPQSRKGRGEKRVVDIRYGLGQQLARKAAYPADFLAELAEFMHMYNAENAQLRELGRNPYRKNLTTQDIEMITELVDQFGSKVVCSMLVAFGYAREPYEAREDEPEEVENLESFLGEDDESQDDL